MAKKKDVVVSVDEARTVFEEEGVRVIDVHARGMLILLSIPRSPTLAQMERQALSTYNSNANGALQGAFTKRISH